MGYEIIKARIEELAKALRDAQGSELVIRRDGDCELDGIPLDPTACAALLSDLIDFGHQRMA